MRQPIEFALGPTRVRDCGEQRERRLQRLQGDLRLISVASLRFTDSDLFCSTESSATPSASGSLKAVASGTQLRALNSPAVDRTQIDLVLIAHKKCVRTTVYYNIFGRKPTLRRLRAEDCDYESLIRIAIDFLTAHLQAWR